MKKLIFALIAVLFALSLITCEVFTPPEASKDGEFDYDDLKPGEFYIATGTGGSRALTQQLASAGADFFEVVLVSRANYTAAEPYPSTVAGTEIVHRATFREGRNGRMEAPAMGTYTNTPDTNGNGLYAYLFAGRYDDKTLLGIGTLTSTDTGTGMGTGPANAISTSTRAVQFTVQALTTNVNADFSGTYPGTGPFTSTSTFKPWDADPTTLTPGNVIPEMVAKLRIDGTGAPIFLLQTHNTGDAIEDIPYDIKNAHAAAIVEATVATTTETPEVERRGYIWSDGDYPPVVVPGASITSVATYNNTAGTAVEGIRLMMDIETGMESGLGRLSVNVPVVMFTEAVTTNRIAPDNKPELWYLRGGLNNAVVDMGPTFNQGRGSMGGAILIGVGNVLAGAGGFIIGKTDQP